MSRSRRSVPPRRMRASSPRRSSCSSPARAGTTSGEHGPSVTAPAPRRAALAFIFVTVVLDMLALGMIVPVLPKLIVQFEGGDTASAARIYGVFGTVWALMQLVSQPVLGALSDRVGRRPVLLLSMFGLALDY